MAERDQRDRPLLNPVLALRKAPVPQQVSGGGAGSAGIVDRRLNRQRRHLAGQIDEIIGKRRSLPIHGGRLHLVATMFGDSLAPSWTPRGLFDARFGQRLVAPAPSGYLVEATLSKLSEFAEFIRSTDTVEARVAISRVRDIAAFEASSLLSQPPLERIWDEAAEIDGARAFVLWLAPFVDDRAKDSVITALSGMAEEAALLPSYPETVVLRLPGDDSVGARPVVARRQTSLARALRRYRGRGAARCVVGIRSRSTLRRVAASGVSIRIDPVRRYEVTAPGVGVEPRPPVPDSSEFPVVAVVDGGLTAQTYFPLEDWRSPPLVPNGSADHVHGNRVTSLVVHAHAWNNRLPLPELHCRIGTVQAIPRASSNHSPSPEQLVIYLRRVMQQHPEVKVWNMSFNEVVPEDAEVVSYLGHEIAALARERGTLPIVSIGNKRRGNPDRLCAPADCEAGITVAGREFDSNHQPAGPCRVSLRGPGPDGMLKPDVSWFSHLRMIGGTAQTGSSYAVPLVSSLAAHTFSNLKEPTADLVKALIINATERTSHDPALGWGTPFQEQLPWTCPNGSVTLAWRADLRPGYNYYWNDIPIPPELIKDGQLVGSGRLTAILRPLVSPYGGANYFSTRLQVALQYKKANGSWSSLLGSMKEDRLPEKEARADLAKWHPVRRLARDFSGLTFSGNTMRLYARVFARDLFQYEAHSHHDLGEQEVTFVLSLSDGTDDPAIYNSTAQRLGTFVESAVLGQEIEVEHDDLE